MRFPGWLLYSGPYSNKREADAALKAIDASAPKSVFMARQGYGKHWSIYVAERNGHGA